MRLPFAARRRAPCDITGTRPTIRTWTSPPRERSLRSRNRLGVFQGFREKYLGAYLNGSSFAGTVAAAIDRRSTDSPESASSSPRRHAPTLDLLGEVSIRVMLDRA